MYFIHIVLNRKELESKKWIFRNFVIGGEVLHVCVLMSVVVGGSLKRELLSKC